MIIFLNILFIPPRRIRRKFLVFLNYYNKSGETFFAQDFPDNALDNCRVNLR